MSHPGIPYVRQRLTADAGIAALRDFRDTLRMRRTVRNFSGDPIPDELLTMAVECANSAPSGANMQPWTFVIVTDPAVKRRIREAAETEEYDNYHGRMPEEWLRALAPLQTDWHKEFLEVAPALIAVFKADFALAPDGTRITHYYVNESVGIACGFLLAALNAAAALLQRLL